MQKLEMIAGQQGCAHSSFQTQLEHLQVLEIGCGNGVFTRRLIELRAADHILATDFSERQLMHAKSRTASAVRHSTDSNCPSVGFLKVDATRQNGKVSGRHEQCLAL